MNGVARLVVISSHAATQSTVLDKSKSTVEFNHVYFERDEELVCIELKPDQALVEGSILEVCIYVCVCVCVCV